MPYYQTLKENAWSLKQGKLKKWQIFKKNLKKNASFVKKIAKNLCYSKIETYSMISEKFPVTYYPAPNDVFRHLWLKKLE